MARSYGFIVNETKQRALQTALAIVVAGGVIISLMLIQRGGERLIFADGTDHAEASLEQTGELTIISTRYLAITPEGIGQLIGGVALMAATLLGANQAKRKLSGQAANESQGYKPVVR